MLVWIVRKSNFLLAAFIFIFLVGYILFSSLSTALGFEMESLAQKQNETREDYEARLAELVRTRGKDALSELSAGLGLVETTLADGYVDIRSASFSAVGNLANRQ